MSTAAHQNEAVRARAAADARRRTLAGVATAYRWEWTKLGAQLKTQAVVVVVIVAPFLFVAVEKAQSTSPTDTLFGRWVHTSGFAIPLVALSFAAQWAFPALACIVAGDIFSSEDRHRTWKTILTRSRTRGQIFAGKALVAATWTVLIVIVLGGMSLLAGAAFVGRQPMIGLTGQVVDPGACAGLVVLSWLTTLPAVLGFAALGIFCSVLFRSSVAGVGAPVIIGLLMQLSTLITTSPPVKALLLSPPLESWHGLWTQPRFTGPFVQGVITCTGYVVVFTVAAYVVAARRDVAAR